MRLNTNPKSNTWILLIPVALWFVGAFAYTRLLQEESHGRYDSLVAAGLSIPFFATAVAQLRSGYIWRNLAAGNRGVHRSERPRKFIFSTTAHFVIGAGIAACFVHQFNTHGEKVVAPNRSLPPSLKSTSTVRGSEDF